MEIKPSAKNQLLSPSHQASSKKLQKSKPQVSKKPESAILGKRRAPTQKLNSMMFELKENKDAELNTEGRRWSQEEQI